MARISLRLSDELDGSIEDVLGYGDSKSEFLRTAAREKLKREHGVTVPPEENREEGDESEDAAVADAD